MRKLNKILFGFFCFLMIIGFGCTSTHTRYSEFKNLPVSGWASENPIVFNLDSVKWDNNENLDLTIRHDDHYPYKNLWIYIDYINKTGEVHRSRLECKLSDIYGNWQGKGFGSTYEYNIQLQPPFNLRDIKEIILWQGLSNKRINGLINIGLSSYTNKN